MRSLPWLLAAALFGAGLVSCGSAHQGGVSATSPPRPSPGAASGGGSSTPTPTGYLGKRDADNDLDNPTGSRYDSDDYSVLDFGHPASAPEARAIVTLLRRYYTAATAADGAAACPLIYSLTAEAFAEEHGQISGPNGLATHACAPVMSQLFERQHERFLHDTTTFHVTIVRIKGARGLALFDFAGDERRMPVRRERGAWKVAVLLDVAALP